MMINHHSRLFLERHIWNELRHWVLTNRDQQRYSYIRSELSVGSLLVRSAFSSDSIQWCLLARPSFNWRQHCSIGLISGASESRYSRNRPAFAACLLRCFAMKYGALSKTITTFSPNGTCVQASTQGWTSQLYDHERGQASTLDYRSPIRRRRWQRRRQFCPLAFDETSGLTGAREVAERDLIALGDSAEPIVNSLFGKSEQFLNLCQWSPCRYSRALVRRLIAFPLVFVRSCWRNCSSLTPSNLLPPRRHDPLYASCGYELSTDPYKIAYRRLTYLLSRRVKATLVPFAECLLYDRGPIHSDLSTYSFLFGLLPSKLVNN